MSQLKLFLFGPPRLQREGKSINISLRKALALLAYLVVTKQSHSRDALAALLWPDDSQSKARGNLRRALSRLNKALSKGRLEIDRENAGLSREAHLWLDVDHFQRNLAECQTHGHPANEVCPNCLPLLIEAASCYNDDFLAGFSLPDCPDFDEWQFFQSEGLRQALASALERLVRGLSDQGDYDVAIPYARRWLALDPLHEPAHRRLMELYAQTGQQAAAVRQYEECVRVLDEELGVPPSEETTALYEAIKAKRLPRRKADKRESQEAGGQRGRGAGEKLPPHNLSPHPTPFIGREKELAEITRGLIDPAHRLLTLVGPGGIGKTRLAVEAGARLLPSEAFPGGIYFVSLAAITSPDFLVSAIAESLKVTFYSGEDPKVQLLDFLAELKQPMLLVLDNFEQLAEGADLLAAILQHAPALKLLVTSRERLNLRDEWLFDLRGLPFPPALQPDEALESYSAVQLFLQTATRLEMAFALSEADKPHLVRICQLVEGMPLGLELAAAWVRVLSCQEIAQEIKRNLEFLATSLRDIPARHRSLAAVFDHSWNHLSCEEQGVFRRLAVFRGGFTREAAEQVAGASLPLLAALVDKSMLRRNVSGRYELHELLRQCGSEKLEEAGETEQTQDRHSAFFLKLAEEAEPKLRGAEQATWLKKLNIENGNLGAALAWSLEGGDAEIGLRLAATLGQFWHMRGHLLSEGIEWLEKGLSRTGESAATALQAKTLRWLGRLTYLQGDDAKSRSAYAKSLALYRELRDKEGIADALFSLGNIVGIQGDEVAARSFYAEARSFCEESLAILREGDDQWRMAASLNILAEMARVTGDYDTARSFYEESLVIRRKLGDQRGTAISLINLGFVANYQGDYPQAATFFAESLALFQKHGGKRGIVDCVAGLGGVTGGIAQPERAARLLGAAQAQREALHLRLEYPDRIEYDRDVAAVRAQLDEATFAAAWAEGRQMAMEQAVQEALAVGEFVQASALSLSVSPRSHNLPPQPTPFIGREAELAALDDLIANSDVRLVTVVGPGGMGKTRLALALAERQLTTNRFPNGVYLINLAPLSSAVQIIPAMVEALKFPLDTGEQQTRSPKQQILDYLRQKQMLLVLDNFEHLLSPPSVPPDEHPLEGSISGAEELVIDILQTAADVRILVTSRERLHLHGEQLFPLQGLTFPDEETVKPVVEYDAIKLFVQSARRVRPDFELGTDDISNVTQVCRLVEGLPLGLELAASWVDMLSLADIAAEIRQSLDFLETDVRNVPERQWSIRAVFDTSWQRMSAAEQKIFPQLAVFRGGFTRQAAQEITGASLRLLGTLASKSLLQYDKDRDRYQIHELLRQYGVEKLSAKSHEESDLRDRHSAYYCTALREREADLKGPRQQAALREIEADSENVRAAWHWAVQQEATAQLALAMNTLGTFYEWQGRFRDGAAAFRALLASPLAVSARHEPLFWVRAMAWASVFQRMVETTEVAHETLAQALKPLEGLESSVDGRAEQAFWHYQQGNLALSKENAAAQAAFLTSLGLYRQIGDQWGIARALHGLGETLLWLGDFAAAGTHLAESLEMYRSLGDLRGMAAVTLTASITARYQGRLEESLRLGEECLEISQKIGNRSLIAEALGDLGMSHGRGFGRYAQAYDLQDQGLAIAADLGNPWQLSNAYYRRGELAAHLGDFKAAEDDLRQAVAVDLESGYRLNMAYALAALGQLLTAVGEQAEARGVLSQALSIWQELDHPDGTLICTTYLTLLEKNSSSLWKAEQQLFEILKGSHERRAWVPYELVLPAIVALLVEPREMSDGEPVSGRLILAIEIAGLVDRGSQLRQRLIFDHLNELAASLPPDVVAAAKERGRQLGWWQMASYLLEALPKLGWGQPEAEEPGSQKAGEQESQGAGEKLPPHNLPPQPTPFVGRETELATLDDLITNPDLRLITIVGPGGIGKTRLALASAERQLSTDLFPNGVYFVSLAPLTSAEHIIPTLAEALDFPLDSGEQQTRTPRQQILDYLRQKQILIVMDNFEHLLDGVELMADILQAASKVQIIATSRERLHLHEEQLYPIQGLEFPDWETVADAIQPGDTAEYTAVKLFLQSARRVQPDFEVVAADLTDLVRICRMVEGMPLGVELAAAWVDLLPLRDIAGEIQKSLDFLAADVRNLPERHRSMRAVFDASWQQMNETEREMFPQLSVFRGGFTRQAAQDVTGASLRLLGTLASKSLLQYNQARDRYQIHELLGQYGADRLAEQISDVRDRHSAYYCARMQQREANLKGARQQADLAEIEADIENVRAAWDWAVAQGQVERLGQTLDSLGYFYEWRGRFQEGETVFRLAAEKLAAMEPGYEQRVLLAKAMAWQGILGQFLGHPEFASQLLVKGLEVLDSPSLANQDTQLERAFILLALGEIAHNTGDRQEARQLLEQSLAFYEALKDRWGMANALQELSTVTWHLGAYDEARQLAEESLALRQRLVDRRGKARSLDRLGMIVMYQGQIEASQQFLREAIALHRELGDLESVATATGNFGVTYELSGEFAQARELSEQAVAIYRDMGVRHSGLAHYLNKVGHATVNLGSYKEARPHVQAGLTLARELDDQRNTALALLILGQILLAEAEYVEAQQRLEESVIIYRAIGQQGELTGALSILSLAAHGLGHISEAEQHAYEALRIAVDFHVVVQWLEFVLPVTAYLLASQGEQQQAVKLYALASRYPYIANSRWFEDVVGQHITAAAASLPPEVVDAAKARGQALDFWETIADLLEELPKLGWRTVGTED